MSLDAAINPQNLTTTLHYLKRGPEKPAYYRIEAPPGVPQWNGIDDPHEVGIEDARGQRRTLAQSRSIAIRGG